MENALSSIFQGSSGNMGIKKESTESAPATDTVPKKVLERIMKQVVDLEKQMKSKMASKDAELSAEKKINLELKQKNEKLGKIVTNMDSELSAERKISLELKKKTEKQEKIKVKDEESEVEALKLKIQVNDAKMDEVLEENRVLMEKMSEIEKEQNIQDIDQNDLKESLEKMRLQNSVKQSRIKSMEKASNEKDTLINELKRKISMMITEFSKGVAEKNEEFKLKEAKLKESVNQKDVIIEELIQKNKVNEKEHLITVKEKNKLTLQLANQLKTLTSEKLKLSSQVAEALTDKNKLSTQLENKEAEKNKLSARIGKLNSQLEKIKIEKNKLETQQENMLARQTEDDVQTEFINQLQNKIAELENEKLNPCLTCNVHIQDQTTYNLSHKRKIKKRRKLRKNRLVNNGKNSRTVSREQNVMPYYSDSEILEASNFLFENTLGGNVENKKEGKMEKLLMINYLWPLIPYKSESSNLENIQKIAVGDPKENHNDNRNHFDLRFPVNEEDYDSGDDSNESDMNEGESDMNEDESEIDMNEDEMDKNEDEIGKNEDQHKIDINEDDVNKDQSVHDLSEHYLISKKVNILGLYTLTQILDLAGDENLKINYYNDEVKENSYFDAANTESVEYDFDADTEESDSDDENSSDNDNEGPVFVLSDKIRTENPNIKIAEGTGEFIPTSGIINNGASNDNALEFNATMDEGSSENENYDSASNNGNNDCDDDSAESGIEYINDFEENDIDNDNSDTINNGASNDNDLEFNSTMDEASSENEKYDSASNNGNNDCDDDSAESDIEYINDFEENYIDNDYSDTINDGAFNDNALEFNATMDEGSSEKEKYDSASNNGHNDIDDDSAAESDIEYINDFEENDNSDTINNGAFNDNALEFNSTMDEGSSEKEKYDSASNNGHNDIDDDSTESDLEYLNDFEENDIDDNNSKNNINENVEKEENKMLDATAKKDLMKRVVDEIKQGESLDASNKETNNSDNDSDTEESGSDDSSSDDEGPVFVLSDKIKAENPNIKIAQNATVGFTNSGLESPDLLADKPVDVDSEDDLNVNLEENVMTLFLDSENLKASTQMNVMEQRPTIIMENKTVIKEVKKDSPHNFPHLLDHDYCSPYTDKEDETSSKLALSELIAEAKAEQMSRCKSIKDQDEVLKAVESIMSETSPPKQRKEVFSREDEVLKAIESIMPETESAVEVRKDDDIEVVDELDDLIQQLSEKDKGRGPFITRTIIGKDGKPYQILTNLGQSKDIEPKLTSGKKRKSSDFDIPNDKKSRQSPVRDLETCDICEKYTLTSDKSRNALHSHKVRCRRDFNLAPWPTNLATRSTRSSPSAATTMKRKYEHSESSQLNERSHCDICGEYYKNASGLAVHKATRHKRDGFLH